MTRLFSKDLRADWLRGERPSFFSVWKADLIAASSPIVVLEALSIVETSLWSVWSAVDSAEFDELLPALLESVYVAPVGAAICVSAPLVVERFT